MASVQQGDMLMGYKGSAKLKGKVCIVTGADRGAGRYAAAHFAREGAAAVVVVGPAGSGRQAGAEDTKALVIKEGTACLVLTGDVGDSAFCNSVVEAAIKEYGRIDVLVNNAAEPCPVTDITQMDPEAMRKAFKTNIYSQIYMCRAAWPHLKRGSSIINASSLPTASAGGDSLLLDGAATAGAVTSFSRALHMSAVSSGIRVNAVTPGPVLTPVGAAPAAAGAKQEVDSEAAAVSSGPCYVFLAGEDSSYISGQVLHTAGGGHVGGGVAGGRMMMSVGA
ncbi:hypothetical protein CHLRE_01g005400v5 [Chlamydomonas reinhardtii]|uniref:Uncharacterized protein n=1 Tax=Chlamydomonas reinhardtii TaxID=3055 RepID=A0A2K3E547_CHLRE|nr:uncharacterized protein CHLRE_01g005400v5 [Chlamydomonas reinhardtii]PNW87873.1 hypothetical protein CHLRE_01g005400v5 [Chlamydomonas reinhardtii]